MPTINLTDRTHGIVCSRSQKGRCTPHEFERGLLCRKLSVFAAAVLLAGIFTITSAGAEKARGPLRVHPTNPRYFTDGSGKAIYLTGSHTWASLQEYSPPRDRVRFDYNAYLNFLSSHNHNFMRMWAWESPRADDSPGSPDDYYAEPMPFERTGPGKSSDGGLKFDLAKTNQAYFDRLRSRVIDARDRGIYVSVMLFQGWSVWDYLKTRRVFKYHMFHNDNNINGIHGDPNGNGEGEEVHSLAIPAITRIQENYVRKVVDTVNDLDNVLFEIANEDLYLSKPSEWQYHFVRFIKEYERGKPKQHPVGMTAINEGDNSWLFSGPSDWISPRNLAGRGEAQKLGQAVLDPVATDGSKVIIYDTDHLGWLNFADDADYSRSWVWKSFTRGYNPILMEIHQTDPMADPRAGLAAARKAMGQTLSYARRVNLAAMAPRADLSSPAYCLANPGKDYLIYLPQGGDVTVDLSAAPGPLVAEWFNPRTGVASKGGRLQGGARRSLRAPFAGDAVLYLALPSGSD